MIENLQTIQQRPSTNFVENKNVYYKIDFIKKFNTICLWIEIILEIIGFMTIVLIPFTYFFHKLIECLLIWGEEMYRNSCFNAASTYLILNEKFNRSFTDKIN